MAEEFFTYFHAGALFNLKELTGNALLADSIWSQSSGRYKATLPQDMVIDATRPSAVRDADLIALLSADVALFNFDGAELDSGTVAEFMVAKFADIPAVILRSDFRRSGDGHVDAWNLMLSDYPRTRQVIVHSMEVYQEHKKTSPENSIRLTTDGIAREIVAGFDEVREIPSILAPELRAWVYRWISCFPGFDRPLEAEAAIKVALETKLRKRLL